MILRREAKADRGRVDARRIGARDAHERAQPGPLGRAQRAQTGAHEAAVLPAQRHAVSDRRERDEVEVAVGERRVLAGGGQQRGREFVGDAGRAEVDAGIAADRRVHDRRVGQHAVGARAVVVGDDDVHPRGARRRDLVDGGDRAVGGDEQLRTAFGEPPHGGGREAVAVLRAAGQKPVRVGTQRAQDADEDRRRADAVDVVVAVDRDPVAGLDVHQDEVAGVFDVREPRRLVALAGRQPGARRVGVGHAAADEHLRHRMADAELTLEGERGGKVAGRDLQAGRVGGHCTASYGPGPTETGVGPAVWGDPLPATTRTGARVS